MSRNILSIEQFDINRLIDELVEQNWSVSKNFLPSEQVTALLDEIRALWNEGNFKKAGIGKKAVNKLHPEIRSDLILWLDPENLTPPQNHYWRAIENLRLRLNQELFLGLNDFEAHIAAYPPGGFYKKHLDQFKQVNERLISCILYLNQSWEPACGGQLKIYTGDDDEAGTFVEVHPEAGTFVCFRSDLIYHEVLQAKRERFSVTGWLKKSALFF